MAYSVDQLNCHPEPSQRRGGRPLPAHWPRPAPEPESDQRKIEDDEAALEVWGDQAAHEACRGKHVIEPTDVFLNRVSGLRPDQSEECELESCHGRGRRLSTAVKLRRPGGRHGPTGSSAGSAATAYSL